MFRVGDRVYRTATPWRGVNPNTEYTVVAVFPPRPNGRYEIQLSGLPRENRYDASKFTLLSREPGTLLAGIGTDTLQYAYRTGAVAASTIVPPPITGTIAASRSTEPAFKVGDWCRIVRNVAMGPDRFIGAVKQIVEIDQDSIRRFRYHFYYDEDVYDRFYQYQMDLELVDAPKNKALPATNFRDFIKAKETI